MDKDKPSTAQQVKTVNNIFSRAVERANDLDVDEPKLVGTEKLIRDVPSPNKEQDE